MKPVIGITSSLLENDCRDYYKLYTNYCQCISDSGGIPVIIPAAEKSSVDVYLDMMNGLLLSGGPDIAPAYYGQEVKVNNITTVKIRDESEILLTEKALEKDMPVLGICRGMQVLNVASGGTLYQDINRCGISSFNHSVTGPEEYSGTHMVTLNKGSILFELFQREKFMVNSIHHQAVEKAAPGFAGTALSEDGIIEGIESSIHYFAIGVQWHPERMVENYPFQYRLFDGFITRCSRTMNR